MDLDGLNVYAQTTEDLGYDCPDHNKPFTPRAVVDGNVCPNKAGKNEKEAKQDAAKRAPTGLQDSGFFEPELVVEPSRRFASEFDSIEHLGRGGFGRVYKARQRDGRFYAVKIVRFKEKALQEVEALAELQHPNIVRYCTAWIESSEYKIDSSSLESDSSSQSSSDSPAQYLYIQMELCDEETLEMWIDKKNTQQQDHKRREEGLTIMKQILNGVVYIHSKNRLHRDLKPANIMFGSEGEVKIGDFGLVTAEDNDSDENLMEQTEETGTKSYMAPEQASHSTCDRKVDIFALGLIYFEVLCYIFTHHERKKIWDGVRGQKLPTGFSLKFPQEHKLIMSMLSARPEDRPEASKVKTELELISLALDREHIMKLDSRTIRL